MKCEFGFCMVCEKEIARGCPTCSRKTPTHEYTEVEIEWTNKSRMKIAVCADCAKSHAWETPEAKEGITKAHWAVWDKQNAKYDKEIVVA